MGVESSAVGQQFDLTRMEKAFANERLARVVEAEKKARSILASAKALEDQMLASLRAEVGERLSLPPRAVVKFTSDKQGALTGFEVVEILPDEEPSQEPPKAA